MTPGLLKAISTLAPGAYSAPFVQEGQLQIIRLLSKVPAKQLAFKAARSQVKKDWMRNEVGHLFDQQVEQLANLSYMHADELASTANALGVKLKTTPFFSRREASVKLLRANPALVKAAFSDEVLLAGHNSTVIHLHDNSVVVLRVLKRQLAKAKPLSAVKKDIVSALRDKKQRARSGLFVYQLSEGLNKQQAPQSLMAQHGLRWHDETTFTYDQKKLPAELISAVFKTVPAQVSGESGIDTVMLADGTAFLFKVFSAKAPVLSGLDKKKKAELTEAITELNERALAALSVKAVVDSAQVKSVASH
jgi:peptidyl-prolyl cis-trans isomerase D